MVRVKHRYLVAQILYPEASPSTSKPTPGVPSTLTFRRSTPPSITSSHLFQLIRGTIAEIFGEYGAGICGASLAIKYYSATTSTLIVRCTRERSRLVWTALTLITNLPMVVDGKYRAGVPGLPCVFRVVHHSGTIRKSEERIIQMARQEIVLMRKAEQVAVDDLWPGLGDGSEALVKGAAMMTGIGDDRNGDDVDDDWDEDMLDTDNESI